ncbi:MAG: tRNA nuclease WapA precursor [Firmicutes bacterium ADurb.Bin419]|nr:MAG: tRNA nuclease WapA precursor [Firmicutes bacterium ADurb.Bin419]
MTGLYYLNARHYDPGTARFLEMDTYTGNISDPLSLNLYSYCRNEPIMYTDPTGHYTQGKVLSYVEGQKQSYDPDAWELQQDLIKLGYMSKDDVPEAERGYYGPDTVNAVNEFKIYFYKVEIREVMKEK